jgi:hypothetical protein
MYRPFKILQYGRPPAKKSQTTDQDRPIVDGVQEPPQLKIEIPANRYAEYKPKVH